MKYDPQYNDAITSMQEKHRYNTVQVQFPVDTLVHMGAGRCRELNAYLALKPQRILLVEADSLLVEDLKKRTDQHPQIQVECAAVAGNPGPVHFYRYNLPDAGSLHPASGLFQLYPGLRLVERVPMEAVGPDTLVQSLNLQDSQGNQLIVDIPGEELSVLQALQRSEKLHLFSRIRLFCGHEPLYEGGEPADRILEWLRNAGFDILNEEDHQDTDRPCWTFHRNAMQLQNREFQKRIEILQGQMEELRLDNVNLKNNIDILRTNVEMLKQERDEYARQVEDRQEQLEEAEKAGEEKTGTIVELREKVKELVGENDRRTQIVEELRANVETFKRERDEYARQVEESQDQLQEVNKAREGERKDATELRAQVGELTSERDEQSRIMGEIRIKADSFRRERDEYVRREEDRQAALEQMQKARKEDAESRAELKEQLEALARQAEDRQKELQEAAKTREEHERTIAEMQEKALKLSGERDEKTKVVSELQTKIEELKKQLEALARQAGDRQKELQEAAKTREEHERIIAEMQEKASKLSGERDGKTKEVSELQAKIEELKKERDEYARQAEDQQKELQEAAKTREENEGTMAELQYKVAKLSGERDEKTKEVSELQAKIEESKKQVESLVLQAENRKSKLEQVQKAGDEDKKSMAELQIKMGKVARERDEQTRVAEERKLLIDKLMTGNSRQVTEISELLKNQKSRLDQMEKGLRTRFNNGLENSIKQLESFIGIQTYLTRDQIIPNMHGWPISPDMALYLINLIEENNYDFILEFGSGTSTILMAKAILKRVQRQAIHQLLLGERAREEPFRNSYQEELGNFIQMVPAIMERALSDYRNVPSRIVSFEHQRQFYDETLAKLRKSGAAEIVELIHAPLRDHVTWEGEHFLYYACEEKIAALAGELSGGRSRILMIVDGPPATTGKHARYPALPIVLQYLADHELDILLDDYVRQDEKEIVERWIKILDDRALVYEKTILKMEKNACRIIIK